jgi:hypothetical protein
LAVCSSGTVLVHWWLVDWANRGHGRAERGKRSRRLAASGSAHLATLNEFLIRLKTPFSEPVLSALSSRWCLISNPGFAAWICFSMAMEEEPERSPSARIASLIRSARFAFVSG